MWINGTPSSQRELDRGLQFGDGHFTTLTLRHGRPRFWPQHYQRLCQASQRLAIALPSETELLACLEAIATEQPDCVVKLIFTRGFGGRGYAAATDAPPQWYATTAPLPAIAKNALTVAIAELRLANSPQLAGLKTLNRLEQVLLAQERAQRQRDELLVTDQQGNVIEAISSNVFYCISGRWYTPELSSAGIAGVVRQVLLQDPPDMAIEEAQLTLQQLGSIEQMFLSNSVLGLRPVAQIGDYRLPKPHLPGTVEDWWKQFESC